MKKRTGYVPPKRAALPAGTIGTPAAARIVGMHFRSLLRWIERDALDPALYAGERGTTTAAFAWSLPELVAARTIYELRTAGLSAQRIRRAVAAVTAYGKPLSAVRLWTDGREAFEVLPEKKLVALVRKPGQFQTFALDEWAATMSKAFQKEISRRERAA